MSILGIICILGFYLELAYIYMYRESHWNIRDHTEPDSLTLFFEVLF